MTKIKRIDSKVSLIGVKWFLYINFVLEIDLLCHNRIEMHECKVIYAQEISTTDLNALEIKFIAFLSNKCNENVVGIFCITHIVLKNITYTFWSYCMIPVRDSWYSAISWTIKCYLISIFVSIFWQMRICCRRNIFSTGFGYIWWDS